jgi:stearoyl-CoA desaturase (delta-9 desaturase)
MVRWGPVAFLAGIVLGTLAGVPAFVVARGLSPFEAVLFATMTLATLFSITLGYHRLFAHQTFRAHGLVQFLVLFFGAGSFQQSAVKWASFHRRHHAVVDTEYDPYNIGDGFFYAHVGWVALWKQHVSYANVQDLLRDRLVRHQNDHYQIWSLASGVLLPLVLGLGFDDLLGAFIFGIVARQFVVLNSAFLVNSAAHTFGRRPFDRSVSAADNALVAFFTCGEGYHNFHHAFPGDYRNGIAWTSWDPTKWLIWVLSVVGLASELRRTPEALMLEAQRAAGGS